MDGGFGAPFFSQAADALVNGFVEAEKVADYAAVQKGAVWVGVGQVGRHQFFVAEFLEDFLGFGELGVS